MAATDDCRLCGHPSTRVFEHLVLGKYQVGYFECSICHSLQTEKPYWLDEAYAFPGVHIDVGQAVRIIRLWLTLTKLFRTIGMPSTARCVDYGGSAGLLTRLMRDSGYDFFSYDHFSVSKYADYFQLDHLPAGGISVVTAFEVFEHLPDPAMEIAAILNARPDAVIFTTQLYDGDGADWEYLVPSCGQHIFFYIAVGLRDFAATHGYDLKVSDLFAALVKRDGALAGLPMNIPPPDQTEIGAFVMEIWNGSPATMADGLFAKQRFNAELIR